MIILAIDPGPEKSGSCLYNTVDKKVLWSTSGIDNYVLKEYVSDYLIYSNEEEVVVPPIKFDAVAIETIEPMGLTLGKSTINTAIWVGRFYEVASSLDVYTKLISRGDEKIVLCGCKTFIDPLTGKRKGVSNKQIRQAIIDRFEPLGGGSNPQVGTKKYPGPLYGVSTHAWSAVGIALTYEESYLGRNNE